MSPEATFRAKAPKLMRRLMAENFGFEVMDTAAISGNGGWESNGFTAFQELRPTVQGSRGGWSWFQWTGPRRRAFEEFCKKNGLGLRSDEAATEFLVLELKTTENRAVAAVKRAHTLRAKVVAFEMAYERAGVKHYDGRERWAKIAMDAYSKSAGPVIVQPAPTPVPPPPDVPAPPTTVPRRPRGLLAALLDLIRYLFKKEK